MKKHIFPLVLIGITILIWIIVFPNLSLYLPIHWALRGEANRIVPKMEAVFQLVGVMVVIYALLTFLPLIDPRKENFTYFSKKYHGFVNSLLVLFFFLNIFVILIGLGYKVPMFHLGTLVIGIIFLILANFIQKIRPNFTIGIRTPWTLSNDEIWEKTHRLAAKCFFLVGIISLLSIFVSTKWITSAIIVLLVISLSLPVLYSYWLYRNKTK